MNEDDEDKADRIITLLTSELGNVITPELIAYIESIWKKKKDK